MNKFLLILTAFLLPFASKAKIIETAHVADALAYIDADTWFLVDLDNTMFEGKQALGHADWFYDELQQRIQKGLTREEAFQEFYPEWVKTQQRCPVKTLEDDFVPILCSLQQQGIVVMGLTHRQPPVAPATVRQVTSLGFDFITTAPSKDTFAVPAASPTLYIQGILFVSDYNKKSDVFLPFLSIVKQTPKKVVFIDDKRKNVEELEQALTKLGIEYVGLYYTAIEHSKRIYSRELAEFQYHYLDHIMSNEAATLLMEHGIR